MRLAQRFRWKMRHAQWARWDLPGFTVQPTQLALFDAVHVGNVMTDDLGQRLFFLRD